MILLLVLLRRLIHKFALPLARNLDPSLCLLVSCSVSYHKLERMLYEGKSVAQYKMGRLCRVCQK